MDTGKVNNESDQKLGPDGQEVEGGTTGTVKRKVAPTKPTRASARLRNQWLPMEVFCNELLRKKIVDYAIFSGRTKTEKLNNAYALRLVGKSWNETVIKLLHQRQEPLFDLHNHDGGGGLERFCTTFASSTPINGSIPPFSLWIIYVEGAIQKGVYNLLTQYGSGLIQLNVRMITKGKPSQSQIPNWSLPRLGKLDVTIILDRKTAHEQGATFGQDVGETDGSRFSKALREAATNVKFKMTLIFERLLLPPDQSLLESITILPTVTHLVLKKELRNADIEVLARTPLPNLASLDLGIHYRLLSNGSLFRILDNYRASLKKLSIADYSFLHVNATLIRFPIMEKLKKLSLNSNNLELEPGLVLLERSFPKLRTFLLLNQSTAMLRTLIGYSKFISVVNLHLSLSTFSNLEGSGMEKMQRVNFAFPNVRKLTLTFSRTEASGLKYMFQEMTQLTELKLTYWGSMPQANPDFWDALLVGVSLETVAKVRQDPGFWERSDMTEEEAVGINNLQELTTLTLCGYWHPCHRPLPSFISDITFQLALLKMPNLKKLFLCDRFEASVEMAAKWRSEGRMLEYSII